MLPHVPSLDELYKYVRRNAHLDEYRVTNVSPSLGPVSFICIDRSTLDFVEPVLVEKELYDCHRGEFMLDISLLGMMRQGRDLDKERMIAVDVHFNTLHKVGFRTKYLPALSDFATASGQPLLLNVCDVPQNLHVNHLSDQLRYALPVTKHISVELTSAYLAAHDLAKTSVKHLILSVTELTNITNADNKDVLLKRLAKLGRAGKELIVRNDTEVFAKSELAYYL